MVTAVLVAHDGARWLPDALAGLLGQERPVQYAVAADTGSADDSSRLVAEALGDDRVLHLARRTGFGQAVEEAARTAPVLTPEDLPYLRRPSGWDPVTRSWRDDAYDMPELPHGEPVHWLWLLHDDCAPEPEALAQLLRVVDTEYELGRDDVAVVGPKLRGWYDRRQLLEVGVSIANSGRRWTGLDRREQDQGQHDHVRTVLSVSTAGMLIRRDVFERLGGFDRRLPLMRDDVDLCWRAHAAGLRVLVAPEAVVRHAEAASRERRAVDCAGRTTASPHKVDKAGAVHTLLVNVRTAALPWVLLRIVLGTLLRTVAYLVGKVPGQALDEIRGLLGVLLRPERIIAGRRERGRPQVEKDELRPLFPPPGATVRATVEQVAGDLFCSSDAEAAAGAGRHGGGIESGPGGDDADFLEIEQFARLKRIARKPGPVLFLILLLVSLAACRALLGGGALAGGALLPVPAGAGELWSRYVDAWHTVGTGGTASAPPYLAIVATVASLLLGSTGLAVTLLMVCSVPLAGATAYFASRPLVPSRLLRAWAAVAYAFLPAATGALAGGRIGTAVLAVLLPLIARAGVAAAGLSGSSGARGSWRATWAYALLLTVTTAFTPVVWPVALVLGIGVLALRRGEITAYAPRFLAQLGTPPAAARPLVVVAAAVRLLRRGRTRVRLLGRLRPRPARRQPRRPRHGGRAAPPRHRAGRAGRPAAFRAAVGRPDGLGCRPGGPGLLGAVQPLRLGRPRHPRLRHCPAVRRDPRRRRGALPRGRAELRLAPAGRRTDRPRLGPRPADRRGRLDVRRRRRPRGAPRSGTGARVRRRGEPHPRPGPHPRPRQRLRRARGLHAGPRLRRPPRRRRTGLRRRREQHAGQGRRQPRGRLRRRPGRPARRVRRALRARAQGRPPRGHSRSGRHARTEQAQPAGRQRTVAGGPGGRARDHRVRRQGRSREVPGRRARARGGRTRGDPHRHRGGRRRPGAAPRRHRRRGLDGHPGRQAADPHHGRRLGPGLPAPRPPGGRAGRHLRRPVHAHRLAVGPGTPRRRPGRPRPARQAPRRRRRPARRAARPRPARRGRRTPGPPTAGPGRGRGRSGGRGLRGGGAGPRGSG
ncbi:Glycosyl transferase, family 2 [Streptomyces lividans 1326]|uniref:Glycosyl transferase, family 2 n=1 Tax=Streptomyces lividans 1326 TaxID=1200984 RepID=A0A7U9HBS7_STRLI|nr:Glycosyl transferase, family 2 [Streptomyces lividans 1326]